MVDSFDAVDFIDILTTNLFINSLYVCFLTLIGQY